MEHIAENREKMGSVLPQGMNSTRPTLLLERQGLGIIWQKFLAGSSGMRVERVIPV